MPNAAMESRVSLQHAVSSRRNGEAVVYGIPALLAIIVFLSSPGLSAQPTPGDIVMHPIPFSGSFIDAAGNVYNASSNNGYPITPGAVQTTPGGGTCEGLGFPTTCPDAYIGKADPNGNIVFGTLLGGPNYDFATGMTVGALGNVFVVGDTGGSFPTTANAALPMSTSSRGFAAKLSADGSRILYSTYLPGTIWEPAAVAIDSQENVYITGTTTAGHAFVTKLSSDGSSFLYSVVLRGTNVEGGTAIVVDPTGSAIVSGTINSTEVWVGSGLGRSVPGGRQNVFVAKLDSTGNVVFYDSVGGSGIDTPHAIRLDSTGNIYVAGQTTSTDFPTTAGTFQPAPVVPMWNDGGPGGFALKLAADGSKVLYSTYVMGLDNPAGEGVIALAVTPSGEAYLGGRTGAGFPVTESAPQICFGGSTDNFLAHLDARGVLLDASYIGGPTDDLGVQALGLGADGSIMLAWYAINSAPPFTAARIHFGGGGWTAPACLSPDPLNAAILRSPVPGVSPGEFVTLTGFGIGPQSGVVYQSDAQGHIPRQLGGVVVSFDGVAAPLLYVQSRQVNVQAPFEVSGKTSTSILVQYNGQTFGPLAVPVVFGRPGIFRLHPGSSAQAAALNQDATINDSSNPAAPGSVVSLFGTGFGATNPACPTGGLNVPSSASLAPGMRALINYPVAGGFAGSYADILYFGSAPTLPCGVVQINMVVPADAPAGDFLFYPRVQWEPLPGQRTSADSPVGFTIAVK